MTTFRGGKGTGEESDPELLQYIIKYAQFLTNKNYKICKETEKCDPYSGELAVNRNCF